MQQSALYFTQYSYDFIGATGSVLEVAGHQHGPKINLLLSAEYGSVHKTSVTNFH